MNERLKYSAAVLLGSTIALGGCTPKSTPTESLYSSGSYSIDSGIAPVTYQLPRLPDFATSQELESHVVIGNELISEAELYRSQLSTVQISYKSNGMIYFCSGTNVSQSGIILSVDHCRRHLPDTDSPVVVSNNLGSIYEGTFVPSSEDIDLAVITLSNYDGRLSFTPIVSADSIPLGTRGKIVGFPGTSDMGKAINQDSIFIGGTNRDRITNEGIDYQGKGIAFDTTNIGRMTSINGISGGGFHIEAGLIGVLSGDYKIPITLNAQEGSLITQFIRADLALPLIRRLESK
ncbi:hypothetical protein A3D80_02270 [Candidatus Roizmanbacteria bacterium RIFCSPHIGHO2_02_FULL_40_13b]|uniref:Peptidase S1 domain-containing protein n=1 Tax=Candidatus Roizmanbacteria bacterium RIFCSPHIGHO2_01_FULL_39_24 TaxID=1802032 RepID=A0A1F7GJV2_9BACT|nr:MAG: hypothetical protein A2799_00035 [Candidatus Roizmanbacteria bacterium RIFCSPHIGHO2_01_FULL_39_24]OGK26655.1 MAG: hypothetical protein A3D80_02270 [Candidatus Roizmanbacteria bacterium RIFCSPHIGHO2_02_FULL_40_13b]OGK50103.1 MAG: hypothetical protein A3A56_04055 [Candidatus Roizmanbacteria bacterium RIFCSPLOWO2_01_FULL_40_32]